MIGDLVWNGHLNNYIDEIKMIDLHHVTIGIFGGSSSRGTKLNEDGLYVISKYDDFVFSVLFDAHATNESVIYYTEALIEKKSDIESSLKLNTKQAIKNIETLIEDILNNQKVLSQSKELKGETAFLVCLQKNEYLWWLSVGDNSIYTFNKEFNELGQYRLNQRIFYQWIGQKNSMALDVPCYSKGTIQLRPGKTTIVMLTDGVLEIEGRPFENHETLKEHIEANSLKSGIHNVLEVVKTSCGKDNATIIAWSIYNEVDGLRPTRLSENYT